MNLEFKGTYLIKANIYCLTGLHIGGSKESFEIGGIDNPVIKTPISLTLPDGREIKEGIPYIPGSSLKGKMRSLLEWQYKLVKIAKDKKGNIKSKFEIKDPENPNKLNDVAITFGVGVSDLKEVSEIAGPVRIKVYDAYPTAETIKKWEEELGAGLYTEVKTENAIDRITAQANPRQQERVPAGSEFEVEIGYEVYDEEDHNRIRIIFEGMKRVEDNYLGGGGSRGNGRVIFKDIKIYFKDRSYYTGQSEPQLKGEYKSVSEALKNFQK